MHHVRSNPSRCKTNRFLGFFFARLDGNRCCVWRSVANLTHLWATRVHLHTNTISSICTQFSISLFSARRLLWKAPPPPISASYVSLEVYIHKGRSVFSFYFAARRLSVCDQSCPRNPYSLLVRGLFRTNYKLGSGMQRDVGVGGPEGSVQIIKLDSGYPKKYFIT